MKREYITCNCYYHVLGIDEDEGQVSLEWISVCNRSDTLWNRIKFAYEVFKRGSVCTNDILLGKEKVDKLVDCLITARNSMEIPNTMLEKEELEARYKAVKEVEEYFNDIRKNGVKTNVTK